ncbi:MAG: helicase, partial [bacterium]
MKAVEVREKLVDAVRLDLVGPGDGLGDAAEVLPQAPSRWYLTGFLVPLEADRTQRTDESSTDEVYQAGAGGGVDDDVAPEPAAARQRYLPSSIGMSVLSPAEAGQLQVRVRWGDYHRRSEMPEEWARTAREEVVNLNLAQATERAREVEVPSSGGLCVAYLARRVGNLAADAGVPAGARTISVFLVNRR